MSIRKPRSDSVLLNLPKEQQAQLAQWLLSGKAEHVARELCIKEFGVVVALSAFSEFWKKVCSPELIRRRWQAVRTAEEIAQEAKKHPGRWDEATIEAIKQKAFELCIAPGVDPEEVKAIFSLVFKVREQDLDQAELELKRKKLELEKRKHKDEMAERKRKSKAALKEGSQDDSVTKETQDRIAEELKLL
jgi:hypothetical protein